MKTLDQIDPTYCQPDPDDAIINKIQDAIALGSAIGAASNAAQPHIVAAQVAATCAEDSATQAAICVVAGNYNDATDAHNAAHRHAAIAQDANARAYWSAHDAFKDHWYNVEERQPHVIEITKPAYAALQRAFRAAQLAAYFATIPTNIL